MAAQRATKRSFKDLQQSFLAQWNFDSQLADERLGSTKVERFLTGVDMYLLEVFGGDTRFEIGLADPDNVYERQESGWIPLLESALKEMSAGGTHEFSRATKMSFGMVTNAADQLTFGEMIVVIMPKDRYVSLSGKIDEKRKSHEEEIFGRLKKRHKKEYTRKLDNEEFEHDLEIKPYAERISAPKE